MTMKLSDAAANFVLDSGWKTMFAQNDILEIRSGSPPADANAAQTGTVLATIALPATPFGATTARSTPKNGTWQDASADAAGTAGYFLLRKAADGVGADSTLKRVIGTITATGGGGDMTLDNTNIAAAQQVTVNTFAMGL